MQIVQSNRFVDELNEISDFIAKDSITKAKKFQSELLKNIQIIAEQPFLCRKSINFNDDNVRDFIFKGYVIPYFVNDKEILLLGIYKSNLWKSDDL